MRTFLLLGLLAATALAGCAEGSGDDALPQDLTIPSYDNPPPASVTGLEFVARLEGSDGEPFPSGAGNWIQGDYVFGSALGHGFFIADVSDPAHPVVAFNSTADSETPFSRKAEVVTHPDGRLTLVLATQSNGLHLWDATDPAHPVFASAVEFERNHNVEVVPGQELVFNLPSSGAGSTNSLVDVSDPFNPRVLGEFGTYGCHTMSFWGIPGTPDAKAFCAAIQRSEIWDVSAFDASAKDFGIVLAGVIEGTDSPVTGSPVANPSIPSNPVTSSTPLRNLHHFVAASNAGTILIVGDEHRGGGNPGACFAYDETTGRSTPLGALWFYDISDPADPVLLSWISPPTVQPQAPGAPSPPSDPATAPALALATAYSTVPNCTAHFGTVVPGEDKIVIGWYSAGVLLIDFTDPTAPRILDQYQADGINTWNARVYNGYVYTGDIGRGMDVLKLV